MGRRGLRRLFSGGHELPLLRAPVRQAGQQVQAVLLRAGEAGGPAEEYSVIHSFPLFWKRYIFVQEGRARKKEEKDYVTVRVAVAK